jgi:uncharacterized protein YkwD
VKRYVFTLKRVFHGLKLACMVLFAVVTYAALLKRGKGSTKLFKIFILLGGAISLFSVLENCVTTVEAKPLTSGGKSSAATQQRTPKQIFTRSNRSERSNLLGVDAQAAYIVSSVGSRSGVLVTALSSGGAAARFGISVGDVLLTLNQKVVTTARDADRILQDAQTGSVKVSFAHPSDAGLQLYNTTFAYSGQSAASAAIHSDGETGHGSNAGGGARSLKAQIPGAESQMLGVINQDRATEKAPAISSSAALASLARAHAEDMAAKRFFNHVNKEGLNPQDRANRAGAGPVFENISFANGISSVIDAALNAERQMMSEPPNQHNHRSNIIDPNHKTVGVGIALSKDGVFYMVQEFSDGSP